MSKEKEYWRQLISEIDDIDMDVKVERSSVSATTISVYDVSFTGLYGERIKGVLITPRDVKTCPMVIDYLGYMNYIADPLQFYHWPSIGCACLVIDNRGQGGQTADNVPYEFKYGEALMGRGFLNPDDFYMKRVIADHLLELKIAQQLPLTKSKKIFIRGGSQGGGLAVMIGALAPFPLAAIFADVPSASNIANRIVKQTGSYGVIGEYLLAHPEQREQVVATMAYFDTKNFADEIKAPIYCSVGDQDTTCPMADFSKTYQQINAKKELKVFHGHAHEGGGIARTRWEIDKISELLANK